MYILWGPREGGGTILPSFGNVKLINFEFYARSERRIKNVSSPLCSIKVHVAGNNPDMREIGKGIGETKSRVEKLVGIPLLLKVSEGRGRSSLCRGSIIAVFPAVFTVKLESGEIRTFSYSDVHTRGIMFLKDDGNV